MAGNAVIGALRVVLGADTAALDKGLKDAQGSLAAFGKTVAIAGAAAAAALTAAAVSIGMSIKSAVDEADKLGKMAQSIGLPVDQLSKLKYAADLSDVSVEALGVSMGKLAKNMSATAGGAGGPAADAFKALGVEVRNTDGTLKSSSLVLSDVAEKFKGYEDSAAKTALAIAIFGKSGAAMIPLLNQGRDGLKEAGDEAERYGLVLDKRTTLAAEAFNDNMKRMHAITQGMWTQVAANLLPTFEALSKILLTNKENSGLFATAAGWLTSTLQSLAAVGVLVYGSFKALGDLVSGVAAAVILVAKGQFSEAFDRLKQASESAAAKSTESLKIATQAWAGFAANAPLSLDKVREAIYGKLQAPIIEASEKAKDAFTSFIDSTKKSQAAQIAELETVKMAAGAKESLKITLQGLAVAKANDITLTNAQQVALAAVAFQAGQVALQLQGQRLLTEVTPLWQQYTTELNNNLMALNAVGATSEQIALVGERTAQKFGMSWAQQSASFAGSMGEISSTFASESSSMASAAKIFGAVQALISTYAGSAEALKLPFPLNIAASAAVLAKGLALVASIRSAAVPSAGKFATGGSFTVPGAGGLDTKRIAMDVNPGERVKVEPPQYGAGFGSSSADGRTLNLAVQGEVFGRETLRGIARGLEDLVGNGLKINLSAA